MLFLNKFGDSLLCNSIYVSGAEIIVDKKHFKIKNFLSKKNSRRFPRTAIKVGKRDLDSLYLFLKSI